jgi:hypothetical protein
VKIDLVECKDMDWLRKVLVRTIASLRVPP